jgi:hypothetical protein
VKVKHLRDIEGTAEEETVMNELWNFEWRELSRLGALNIDRMLRPFGLELEEWTGQTGNVLALRIVRTEVSAAVDSLTKNLL